MEWSCTSSFETPFFVLKDQEEGKESSTRKFKDINDEKIKISFKNIYFLAESSRVCFLGRNQ